MHAQDPRPRMSSRSPAIGIEYLVSDGLLPVLVVHAVDFTQVPVEE